MKNGAQHLLTGLFVLYIVFGVDPPLALAKIIDTPLGNIAVILAVLCLFSYSNPVLIVLGILVAHKLIRRSMATTGSLAVEMYYPTEERKWAGVPKMHEFPYTLEQEMVKKMTARPDTDFTKAPFRPVLNDVHDATYL